MHFIVEGILIGLLLAALMGPIFIALTQTAVEKGARAGLTVGLGVWTSDLLIVILCYWFIKLVSKTIENRQFMFWMGIAGGLILITFGIFAFFKKVEIQKSSSKHSLKSYTGFWLKGFVVNTINPFTFVFWIGAISTYFIGKRGTSKEAFWFLAAIIITIVITDTAKVILAKLIRTKLKEIHIQWFTRIAGIGLLIFGIILIARTI